MGTLTALVGGVVGAVVPFIGRRLDVMVPVPTSASDTAR